MKQEEAIDTINSIKHIIDIDNYSDRVEKALDMAITALKEETICTILSDDEVKQPCIKGPCGIERPQGEWKYDTRSGQFICSKCEGGVNMPTLMGEPLYKWCPWCGADMRRSEEK